MNLTNKLITKNLSALNKFIKKSRFCSQHTKSKSFIQSSNSKKIPNPTFLDQRLLKYINTLQKAPDPDNYKLKLVKNDLTNLKNKTRNSNVSFEIQKIDQESCRRLQGGSLSRPEIFLILCSFATETPYYVRGLKFFSLALRKFGFYVKDLSFAEKVQLCFYAGLLKKESSDTKRFLRHVMTHLNSKKVLRAATLDDIIILANAAYKTGTRISLQNGVLNDEIKWRLSNHLNILKDEPFFTTLVKSMRHNLNYDEDILATLAHTMFFNKTLEKYNFTALGHILTLYADALYFDPILIKIFCSFGLNHLKNIEVSNLKFRFSENLRLKDLSRFLFSLSYLGFEDLKNEDFYLVEGLIEKFINLGALEKHIEDFLSVLLSLYMLGYFDENIYGTILKEQFLAKGKHKNAFKSRLNILLTSIKIEQPLFFDKCHLNLDPTPNFNQNTQIDKRQDLVKIFNCLKNSSLLNNEGKCKGSFIEYSYAIPFMNILGITIFDKDRYIMAFVECIDETNSTKYVKIQPHGYMKHKLRLLRVFKKPLLVIDKETIEDMDNSELVNYLEKKLKIAFYLKVLLKKCQLNHNFDIEYKVLCCCTVCAFMNTAQHECTEEHLMYDLQNKIYRAVNKT